MRKALEPVALCIGLFLGGCSDLPHLYKPSDLAARQGGTVNDISAMEDAAKPDTGQRFAHPTIPIVAPKVQDIVNEIACELKAAQKAQIMQGHYLVTVNLTLQVEDTGDLTPNLSYIDVLKTGKLTAMGSADLGGDRRRTYTTNYFIDTDDLDHLYSNGKVVGLLDTAPKKPAADGAPSTTADASNGTNGCDTYSTEAEIKDKTQALVANNEAARDRAHNILSLRGNLKIGDIVRDGEGSLLHMWGKSVYEKFPSCSPILLAVYSREGGLKKGDAFFDGYNKAEYDKSRKVCLDAQVGKADDSTEDSGPPLSSDGKTTPTFGSTVVFTITRSVSALGPSWSLTSFTGPGGNNGLLNGKRVTTDTLVIAFAAVTAPKPAAPSADTVALTQALTLLTKQASDIAEIVRQQNEIISKGGGGTPAAKSALMLNHDLIGRQLATTTANLADLKTQIANVATVRRGASTEARSAAATSGQNLVSSMLLQNLNFQTAR